jgi:hypothetical protein
MSITLPLVARLPYLDGAACAAFAYIPELLK